MRAHDEDGDAVAIASRHDAAGLRNRGHARRPMPRHRRDARIRDSSKTRIRSKLRDKSDANAKPSTAESAGTAIAQQSKRLTKLV